ncbi:MULTISPECIES: ATP-binding cassette domain-containing protein [Bacilli]|uniref:ATP-binding cassette domain-containing protein n=1 Tax=Bacilli TaxID=91061 RepID=UPI0001EF5070|nr:MULTISPECIES: ATP-binding cassette domain-containing protein [Bacilli]OFS47765.1 peptide ABC transporter ATP-binding protein [Staphylococcus sp. HMSC075H09]EFS18400.1 ABC transporter, ATP-binding protein [Staphylococcus hominis subsp. hominis C80]MCI2854827.1 ATP-binding cassette domain-containing protein [Staphylococcus hominis]MDS3852861.1 ATP-binding cassette domain-containing protein [Staphylococcus hominis]OAN99190.1 peptide ABC transporter ATP-binding protein [Staphylococcus hominis]
MNIKNYSLKVKKKILIDNCNLNFYSGEINHIVGKNGVGKSQLAKDFLLNNSGYIPKSISYNTTLISSFSNIPNDVSKDFLLNILKNKFNKSKEIFQKIYKILNIEDIPSHVLIKNLSDGQKQKLRFLSFLLEDNSLIVLDEVTNALDKKTVNEIYHFLNSFIANNPSKTILNITHNLSDISNLPGKYFNFENKKIEEYLSKEKLINDYINL